MSQIKRNIIANFIGKGWKVILNIAFVPLYIKFMGIEAYGLIGFFTSLLIFSSIADVGLRTTLNRELSRLSVFKENAQKMRDLVRTTEIIYWILAILTGGVIYLLAPYIASYWIKADKLSYNAIQQALKLMGLVIAFNLPFSLYSGGLMGLQRQIPLNIIIVISETFRGLGSILALWLISPTIQTFFFWQLILTTIQTLATALFLWFSLPKSQKSPSFQKDLLLEIQRFATGMTSLYIITLMLTQADKIILSKILPLKMFGYYSLAWAIAGGLSMLVEPVFNAIFPGFSQCIAVNDENSLKELYHKSCQLMSVIILPCSIVIAFFAPEILGIWLRNPVTVEHTHRLVSLLIIGSALNGLMNIPYALQLAYGWTKLAFYAGLTSLVLIAPLTVLMVLKFGVIGGAISWIILNSGYILINVPIMHRRLLKKEQWKWYIDDVGKPLITVLIIVLIGRMLLSETSVLITIVGILFLTLFTYLITAWSTSLIRDQIKAYFMRVKYEN